MGSWFSNFHVRKTEQVTLETVMDCIVKQMAQGGYHITEQEDEADSIATVVSNEGSQWISFCADAWPHDDPESCARIAGPISEQLHTDVMGIACFDSDYLYLNLINSQQQLDGWIAIGPGKDFGITRRNNLASWKKKVADYPDFSEKAKHKYVLTDVFLEDAAANLGLDYWQSSLCADSLEMLPKDTGLKRIFFQRDEGAANTGIVKMAYFDYHIPCLVGEEASVAVISVGAQSKGLSVYIHGPFVENEELTFSNVKIHHQHLPMPITLVKEKLDSGEWVYAYHDPEFYIPPAVPQKLKKEKRYMLQSDRTIYIRFTPNGNPRKTLDITVSVVPHANPDGRTSWNAWRTLGSKEALIEEHNKITRRMRAFLSPEECPPILKRKDFD